MARWESRDDDCVAYFCWRMAPKLIELPEFDGLPEPALYPCRSCIRQWEDAVITILSWPDNGTTRVSEEFEGFYNGFLYFANVLDTMWLEFQSKDSRHQRDLLRVLFEIYSSDPRNFPATIDDVLNLWKLIPQDVRIDKNTRIVTIIWQDNASAPIAVQELRRRLYPKIVGLMQGPECCPFACVKGLYRNSEEIFTTLNLPMATGFRVCIRRAFHSCRKTLSNMILERYPPQVVLQESDELEKNVDSGSKIRLFVGPSGCGKTRQLLQSLERQWGLYLLPGNLPVLPNATTGPPRNHPSLSNDRFASRSESRSRLEDELNYQARRSGGSRDTQTWYNDIKTVDQKGFHCWKIANGRISILLRIRLGVLQDFLDLTRGRASPADWLNFQTSFDERGCDIFNDLFRIARLSLHVDIKWRWPMSDEPLRPRAPRESRDEELRLRRREIFAYEYGRLPSLGSGLLICIDEAQCDLQEKFQGRGPNVLAGQHQLRSFHPFNCIIHAATSILFDIQDLHNIQMNFSGTALQLQSTMEALMAEIPEIRLNSQWTNYFKESAGHTRAPPNRDVQKPEPTKEYVNMILQRKIKDSNLDPSLSVESDFQLVQEDSQFRDLMIQQIPDCDEKLHCIIIEHSKPLRGRYQWSVSYLAEIDKVIKRNTETDLQAFSEDAAECCRQVYVAAKEGLKNRLKEIDERFFQENLNMHQGSSSRSNFEAMKIELEKIQTRGKQHQELLLELCWLAIRSDLLGEATIFQSKESAEMVIRGFAFAENTNDARTVILKERIAVEAAVEYFQAQRADGTPSRYDEALVKSFYNEQNNASALGKKVELFFAWHLRKVLRAPEQRVDAILPTFSRRKRMKVLKVLIGQSKNIDKLLQQSKRSQADDVCFETRFGCDPDEMYLIEGAKTAFEEKSDSCRSDTMWEWLKMIRTGSSKDSLISTFWFPSTKAGPDVIFALRRTPGHQRNSLQSMGSDASSSINRREESGSQPGTIDDSIVLCAVQIKRQATDHDIPGAILSTSPNHWFRSGTKPEEAKCILHELREWRKKGHPIVRILVTALTDPPENDPRRKKPMQYLKEERAKPPTRDRFKRKIPKTEGQSLNPRAENDSEDFEDFGDSEIPLDQQYFNWVGAEHDGDLFGAAFKEFNRAERNLKG